MSRLWLWLLQSHRLHHFAGGFVIGATLGSDVALTAAAVMEFKDCHHSFGNDSKPLLHWRWSAWDWVDFLLTLLGGILGSLLRRYLLHLSPLSPLSTLLKM